MGHGGPSGGWGGLLKNFIVFIINYGYIPLEWILNRAKNQAKVDLTAIKIRPDSRIVLTGATGGLGSAVLQKLLEFDADVVVGVRNPEEMKPILQEARLTTATGNLTSLELDLTSLDSVRSFASEISKSDKPIAVLINAAGIQGGPYTLTRDGYEVQFQVNYLGHFLLFNLLIPRMTLTSTEADPGLILNLSSMVQSHGKLDVTNLNSEKWYNTAQAYYNSKLCIAASTHFLGLRLKQKGIHLRVNSIHPGFLDTKQWDHFCVACLQNFWKKQLLPANQGAEDVLYAAFSPDTVSVTGSFFANRIVVPAIPMLKWSELENLWDVSCDLVKIPNVYSLPQASAIDAKLNNEVLLDLDLETGKNGNKKLLNKDTRTLSVITINNLDQYAKPELKRTESKIFSVAPSTVAVAPLEAESAV